MQAFLISERGAVYRQLVVILAFVFSLSFIISMTFTRVIITMDTGVTYPKPQSFGRN